MKIDVAPLQHLMKGSHLGEDNSHTKTWCSDNIGYKIEHAMYKCLHLYPQPRMKISVSADISVIGFYGYIGYIGDISVDIFT